MFQRFCGCNSRFEDLGSSSMLWWDLWSSSKSNNGHASCPNSNNFLIHSRAVGVRVFFSYLMHYNQCYMRESSYNKHCIWCHQFYFSCSILIVNCPCSVTDTKCDPSIICRPWWRILSIIDSQLCKYCYLLSLFSSNFQSSVAIFHHKNAKMWNMQKVD